MCFMNSDLSKVKLEIERHEQHEFRVKKFQLLKLLFSSVANASCQQVLYHKLAR